MQPDKITFDPAKDINEVSVDSYRKTEIPHSIPTFNELATKVEEYLPNVKDTLKLVLAIATSGTRKNRVMLWLMLVGAPSSGKTDLVKLIGDAEAVMSLDNLTLNSFITGERSTEKEKTYDLLPLLNGKCLVIKDWTSLFSLDEKATKKIIGDWVNSYDKKLSKFSSRRGNITYESEFSHVGCITPATLNKHSQYLNMIGPRFLHFIIPDLTSEQEDQSFKAIFGDKDRSKQENEAKQLVSDYLNWLNKQDLNIIKPISQNVERFLTIASRFMAKARGIVITQANTFKNDEGKEITYYEAQDTQIEQPWRAVQQLIELSRYLALVAGKDEVGDDELSIVRDVVISSMPADRANALKTLKISSSKELTAKELSSNSGKSFRTSNRLLEELSALGIVKKNQGGGQIANSYEIEDIFRDFIYLDTAEFLSNKTEQQQLEINDEDIPF